MDSSVSHPWLDGGAGHLEQGGCVRTLCAAQRRSKPDPRVHAIAVSILEGRGFWDVKRGEERRGSDAHGFSLASVGLAG